MKTFNERLLKMLEELDSLVRMKEESNINETTVTLLTLCKEKLNNELINPIEYFIEHLED